MSASHHSFPRHFHETYVIEVVEEGRNEFWCEGRRYSAEPNDIIVIHAGEIHTGYPSGSNALSYRAFYPQKVLMAALCSESGGDGALPRFHSRVLHDEQLAGMLRQAHGESERSALAGPLVVAALGELVHRYAQDSAFEKTATLCKKNKIQGAIDYLSGKFQESVSLRELSTFCGLSEYHFLRTFKDSMGLAPYEYILAARIEECRKLLSGGMSIAEAAARTGFCDQSHLNRHFKRIVGITPGKYVAGAAAPAAFKRDPARL